MNDTFEDVEINLPHEWDTKKYITHNYLVTSAKEMIDRTIACVQKMKENGCGDIYIIAEDNVSKLTVGITTAGKYNNAIIQIAHSLPVTKTKKDPFAKAFAMSPESRRCVVKMLAEKLKIDYKSMLIDF